MWILEWLFGEPVTTEWITVTLPLTATGAKVLLASAGLALGAGLVWLMLNAPDRGDKRRNLLTDWLTALGWVLLPVWFVLLGGTLWHLWLLFSGMDSFLDNVGFGMGAVVAAFLGGPFVIWGAVLKQQTVEFQKEGHITDRISKAVEQLGSEKTVKDADGERTVRNIEVRIGGLLSLERIAQDSTRYDKGRDHVRVMEILCAYVRENAKADDAEISWRERWEKACEGAADTPPMSEQDFLKHVVGDPAGQLEDYIGIPATKLWANSRPSPHADIQLALTIIGRRSAAQKVVEARWPDAESSQTAWVFSPEAQARGATIAHLETYKGYRLDLRKANLQKLDLKGLDFSGAKLDYSRLDGADLRSSRFVGCLLLHSGLIGADLSDADISFSWLMSTRFESCILNKTGLQGMRMLLAKFEGAAIKDCELDGETKWFFEVRHMFGDASVRLPSRVPAPAHWPTRDMEWRVFSLEWREWQSDPDNYTPPPPPE
ncbi:MAG: hypothetical protein CMF72_05795 [Mameliella sp.]|nr:hypothetical protein [Mameliella sp.]|tara:strand:+ start:1158 stop:2621 length:1464 start_codon:yes stop_codon:yes gene_type:complete